MAKYVKEFEAVQYKGDMSELLSNAPKWLLEQVERKRLYFNETINCLCLETFSAESNSKWGIVKKFVDPLDYIVYEDDTIKIVKPDMFKGVEVMR